MGFLRLLASVLNRPPKGMDPYVLITIRADSADTLLASVAQMGLRPPEILGLPPLSPLAYRDIVLKPAEVVSRRGRRLTIAPDLANVLVAEATGADALPLLAFTLARLFMDYGASGQLTLAHYHAMGGVGGSVDRALKIAQQLAGRIATDDNLRRLIVPALATWDPTAGGAKRLVAREADVTGGDRAMLGLLVAELVRARLLTRGRETLEVAHEALLRREPISGWLEARKDALKLRDDLIREASEWNFSQAQHDLVRRGERLKDARHLAADPDFATALAPAQSYLIACHKLETGNATRSAASLVARSSSRPSRLLRVARSSTRYAWPQRVCCLPTTSILGRGRARACA